MSADGNTQGEENLRNVVCPNCSQTIQVPMDLAQAHCVRCGQMLPALETNVTASPVDAIQPGLRSATSSAQDRDQRPQRYANWEDLRANSPAVQRELMELATRALPDLRGAQLEQLPSNLPANVDELGQPLGTVRAPGENRDLNNVVGGCMILGGLCLGVVMVGTVLDPPPQRGMANEEFIATLITSLAMSLAAIAFGVWYIFIRNPWLATTLWIFENGILALRGKEVNATVWEEVEKFRFSQETGRPLFWITLRDGQHAVISAGHAPAMMPLAEYIEIKLSAAQFLPRLRRILRGERVRFGVVELDREGFTSPRYFAPWPKIARVVSDRTRLFVDDHKNLSWHPIRYREVSFPMIVMAIAHVLIEEEKRLPPINA